MAAFLSPNRTFFLSCRSNVTPAWWRLLVLVSVSSPLLTRSATVEDCTEQEDSLLAVSASSASNLELSLLQTSLEVRGVASGKVSDSVARTHAAVHVSDFHHAVHGDALRAPARALYLAVFLVILVSVVVGSYYAGLIPGAAKERQTQEGVQESSEALKPEKGDNDKGIATQGGDAAAGAAKTEPLLSHILFFVGGHCLAASSLTVVNKMAMNTFQPPHPQVSVGGQVYGLPSKGGYVWTLVLIQFLFAALGVRLAGLLRIVEVEPLKLRPAMAYFPASGMFMITIVAGNAVMNNSNVNTFLIIRALVPIPCALLETLLYADPYPPLLSWVALSITIVGAGFYASAIGGFELTSVAWAVMYLVSMPIDGVLIKHSISQSKLSAWGLVYYNNVLASLPLVFYVFMFELTTLDAIRDMLASLRVLETLWCVLLSCGAGVAISFFQLNTRYYISATAFMILGVVNKFLAVLWSEVFLGSNGAIAVCGVLMTLGGAVCWQIVMGQSSVKMRERSDWWENKAFLPFALTLAALAWAAWIQHTVG